jgi:hypothetical protein
MSHFSETLAELLKSQTPPITQAELSERSKVDKSLISRFLSQVKYPDSEQVAALCLGVSGDRDDRIRLLVAFLRDQAAPAFRRSGFDSRHVNIRAVADTDSVGGPSWVDTMPAHLTDKLMKLGVASLESPAVAELLNGVLGFLEKRK